MNLDRNYCNGTPNGVECKVKESCKRFIGLYEVPEGASIWMTSPEESPCELFWPTEDVSE